MAQRTRDSDAENTNFTFRKNVILHKPGFEKPAAVSAAEGGGNHRFRARDEKDVPKESLAARLAKQTTGG